MITTVEYVAVVVGVAFLGVAFGVWLTVRAMGWLNQQQAVLPARQVTLMQCPECHGNGIWLVMDDTEFACRLCDGQRLVTVPGMQPPNPLVRNGVQ